MPLTNFPFRYCIFVSRYFYFPAISPNFRGLPSVVVMRLLVVASLLHLHFHSSKRMMHTPHALRLPPRYKSSSSLLLSSFTAATATVTRRAISSSQLSIHPHSDDKLNELHSKLPPKETLKFGKTFAPHMLQIHYDKKKGGWQSPTIVPFQDLKLSPASAALHYGEYSIVF